MYYKVIYIPKPVTERGAKYGRTCCMGASSALHFTTVGGQTCLGQGAGGGHFVGSGHFTSGHLGLGQGGHSPLGLLHLLQSRITGCGLGIELFNTYWLKSGTGGHSVFNIYLLKSGIGGHGGIVLFNTYWLRSGSRQGGHGGHTGLGDAQGHGSELLHPPHFACKVVE
jgi:hypothetical protein